MTTLFRLADVLDRLGISQSEAARRSGVSFVTINAIVNNKTRSVALQTLDKLAAALGVNPGDLLEREEGKRPHKRQVKRNGQK